MYASASSDPSAAAAASEYYKRNHLGHALCTLCRVDCGSEAKFLQHLGGKTHALRLERLERQRQRTRAYAREAERSQQAEAAAAREAALRAQLQAGTLPPAERAAAIGRHGQPALFYRQQHRPETFTTRVWVELVFDKAEESARPTHRWLSAREQHVEEPPDDYYIYLLVACEGYTTVALKFPAQALPPSQTSTAGALRWDPPGAAGAAASAGRHSAVSSSSSISHAPPGYAGAAGAGSNYYRSASYAGGHNYYTSGGAGSSGEEAAEEMFWGSDRPGYSWNPLQKMYTVFFTLSR